MLRATLITLAAVATLVLVVKTVAAPGPTAAEKDAMQASLQNAMARYDLHVDYPTMKRLERPARTAPRR
jgi:hypothetical protein